MFRKGSPLFNTKRSLGDRATEVIEWLKGDRLSGNWTVRVISPPFYEQDFDIKLRMHCMAQNMLNRIRRTLQSPNHALYH